MTFLRNCFDMASAIFFLEVFMSRKQTQSQVSDQNCTPAHQLAPVNQFTIKQPASIENIVKNNICTGG